MGQLQPSCLPTAQGAACAGELLMKRHHRSRGFSGSPQSDWRASPEQVPLGGGNGNGRTEGKLLK